MRNVVTKSTGAGLFSALTSLATLACGGASSPSAAPAVVDTPTSSLKPSDERTPAQRADPLAASSAAVVPGAPGGSSCDQKVAAAKASGAAAPAGPDATVDPLCQWRIDDARNDVTLGAASATLSTSSGNASPGILQNTDGTPPEVVAAAFRLRAGDVAACGRAVASAPPILRVRIVADATGTITWAAADYRANLPDTARACVEAALRGKPFLTHSPGRMTATYGFAFGANR
jgi:hypothetical protein